MYNDVRLIGRFVKNPELKYSPEGRAYTKFSLAVRRRYPKDKTDFIDCICFGKTAETIAQYMTKGQQAAVAGELHIDTYEGKNGTRKNIEIYVSDFGFLDNKKTAAENHSEWDDLGKEIDVPQAGSLADEPF